MQTGGRATGAMMCGLTLHGNKRHDSCHGRNLLKNSPIQRTGAAFQCEVVTHGIFLGNHLHLWHSVTHSILQRTKRILTIRPGDVTSPTELTHETNKVLNRILINVCLGNGGCSVRFWCAVSNHQNRHCVKTVIVPQVRVKINWLSVWPHRFFTLDQCSCPMLTRFVCTNSCTEHDLMDVWDLFPHSALVSYALVVQSGEMFTIRWRCLPQQFQRGCSNHLLQTHLPACHSLPAIKCQVPIMNFEVKLVPIVLPDRQQSESCVRIAG